MKGVDSSDRGQTGGQSLHHDMHGVASTETTYTTCALFQVKQKRSEIRSPRCSSLIMGGAVEVVAADSCE
jgi:hypothetical protein